MADSKITALTEDTAPAITDLVATVEDPTGTPVTKKATLKTILAILTTNLIGAKVYLSADMTNIGTSATKITFNTEFFDTGSAFDTSTNTFTVPAGKAGYYMCSVNAYIYETITDANLYKVFVYRNGAEVHEGNFSASGTNVAVTPNCMTVLHLDATDTITFYAQSASANADIYSANTHTWALVQQLTQDL